MSIFKQKICYDRMLLPRNFYLLGRIIAICFACKNPHLRTLKIFVPSFELSKTFVIRAIPIYYGFQLTQFKIYSNVAFGFIVAIIFLQYLFFMKFQFQKSRSMDKKPWL